MLTSLSSILLPVKESKWCKPISSRRTSTLTWLTGLQLSIGNPLIRVLIKKLRQGYPWDQWDPNGVYLDRHTRLKEHSMLLKTWDLMEHMAWSLRTRSTQILTDLKISITNSRKNYQIIIDLISVGTTKTTSHIPGYNGFLPRTDLNEKALVQSLG
jgi:hypothetical protein